VTDSSGRDGDREQDPREADGDRKKASRTGRNLPAAVASGVVLVVVVLASLFTYKWLFGVVVIVALGVAMREMIQAFASRGIKIARVPASWTRSSMRTKPAGIRSGTDPNADRRNQGSRYRR